MHHVLKTAASRAEIDSLGAQLVSLQNAQGLEFMWQRDPVYWAGCAPVLFPVVGRLRAEKTEIEGKAYGMNRHGFAKTSEFEVLESGENRIRFVLRSSGKTRECYPYEFTFIVGFTLHENGLTVRYEVENNDSKTIYFGVGGHPGFRCPLYGTEEFSDYELRFEYPESAACPGFQDGIICYAAARDILAGKSALPLRYDLFDEDALIFEGLKSRSISLVNRKTGKGLRFEFPDYDTVAFWTPAKKNAPFLCFEPWRSMGARDDDVSDRLADKKGIVKLDQGETFCADYSVYFPQ